MNESRRLCSELKIMAAAPAIISVCGQYVRQSLHLKPSATVPAQSTRLFSLTTLHTKATRAVRRINPMLPAWAFAFP